MGRRQIVGSLVVALMMVGHAQAQTSPGVPAENAIKLSEIIAKVEKRPQFRYLSEISWETDGYYDITYYTTDKAKVEIKIDPKTGEPR
ncbi:putative membrane protein YkoI [Mesorhizobium soli]|uniref:PepSY domain-containing protein n=1 Tax=Pseudaminobacter soli (ex Li et al. 2025) TaxID=1295366 RepID=UPI0024750469|nr:PepSY domain-containing protein [Mesorhizobium soli]MDH6230556.1 putative membrane protein YkoI [Mesorhizobium soli]